MRFEFESRLIEWRGPAPFVFAPLSAEISAEIKALASRASYGWGCIPVRAQIGATEFTTSLIPRGGLFLLPVKVAVQKAQSLSVGQEAVGVIEICLD
jgi:hypothetical protein